MPDYEEIIQQSQANVKSLSEKLKDLDTLYQEIKALKESAKKNSRNFQRKVSRNCKTIRKLHKHFRRSDQNLFGRQQHFVHDKTE